MLYSPMYSRADQIPACCTRQCTAAPTRYQLIVLALEASSNRKSNFHKQKTSLQFILLFFYFLFIIVILTLFFIFGDLNVKHTCTGFISDTIITDNILFTDMQPSPFCVYKFFDFGDNVTHTVPSSNSPHFDDMKSYPVAMTADLDKYLKSQVGLFSADHLLMCNNMTSNILYMANMLRLFLLMSKISKVK